MGRARYILFGLLVALPLFGGVALTHAQVFKSGNNVTVSSGTVTNDTLFTSGRTLDIAGTINGDVFCAGQNVTISATVNGDVLCAGQNVTVNGPVSGDVRLAGQNVTVNGAVSGSASVLTQTFTVGSGGTIGRDLSVAGQDVVLNGSVQRDVAAAADMVTINNGVGRNVQANVRHLTLGQSAKVGGNVNYTSNNTLTQNNGAQVVGTVTRSQPQQMSHVGAASGVLFGLTSALYLLIAFLVTALVLVLIMPRAFHVAAEIARGHILKALLVGLIASIVVPVIGLLLLITVIGAPLAFLLGLAWLLIVLLSGFFAAYLLGRLVLRDRTDNAIWTMLLGAVILGVVSLIPFIGWIIMILAGWIGIGTILLYLFRSPRTGYHMGSVNVSKERQTQVKA